MLAFLGQRVMFFYKTIPLVLSWQSVFFWGYTFFFLASVLYGKLLMVTLKMDRRCHWDLVCLFLFNLPSPAGRFKANMEIMPLFGQAHGDVLLGMAPR